MKTKAFYREYWDLIATIGLSLLVGIAIYADFAPAVRTPLAMPALFLLPGYALLAALYPNPVRLGRFPRFAASIGLSLIVSGLLQIAAAYWVSINQESNYWILTTWTTALSLIAGYRRHSVLASARPVVRPDPGRQTRSKPNRTLLVVQIVATILLGLAALRLAWISSDAKPAYTEFYILGANGVAADYPNTVVPGEPIPLTIGVVNREQADVQYRIEHVVGGDITQVASLQLGHGETWEQVYTFSLVDPGENHKVTFLLYKGNDLEPYHVLHLWVTGTEE